MRLSQFWCDIIDDLAVEKGDDVVAGLDDSATTRWSNRSAANDRPDHESVRQVVRNGPEQFAGKHAFGGDRNFEYLGTIALDQRDTVSVCSQRYLSDLPGDDVTGPGGNLDTGSVEEVDVFGSVDDGDSVRDTEMAC